MVIADVSLAVRRARFLGAIELFGVSTPLRDGLSAGARLGSISRASSRTSTAPSSRRRDATVSWIPYRSTSSARFGCTSQTARRMRRRLSFTTALLLPSFSVMRRKNCVLATPIAIGVEMRHILRKGSSKFSNEPALAETKHLRSASSDLALASWSSTRAVSS